MKFNTKLIHGGVSIDETSGAMSIPIHMASTFKQKTIGESQYEYSRSGNPTREAVEKLIADLENGHSGFAFASGSAAISTVFALFSSGDHIIVGNDIYGGTFRLIDSVLKRMGMTFTIVDTRDLDAVEAAVRDNTTAIYLETPTNPLLRITDIKGIAQIAQQHHILSIVDNTFATPYIQKPIDLGSDIVIHSASKYLGGHSDLIAGLVVTKNAELSEKVGYLQNAIGAILSPQDSWLLQRGMKTLSLRMQRHLYNAQVVFDYLSTQADVARIYFPGDPQNTDFTLASKQMAGFGAMISFELVAGLNPEKFVSRLNVITLAESLGALESLIEIPSKMTHGAIPRDTRLANGIQDELIRLSVGVEDIDDLISDLDQSFKQLKS
ncbi:aminotransferase class V-fold PLP-dependent enzyme [Leuconostoc carnosum]|uniref:Cystathionine beta-lyase MetC n=2 Tax=Leuconostoc carnosum TaxID=1252 RepID=K0DE25_LEUCJ|nr:aminotransferase class I/II-fold pyridoxal phosphate-dependent enzyme [Leuconostoc carnosum]AFT81772.1 cystathionine beta-lyase MetC [Leuconostoc carnosum JB16]KAA8328363.1 aminotransferase class V-fold PLP-dependent enzyme [Leuconostoc carnosum]KAA8370916.1 aminotransferase class V-fold PLP-dependent enzyme [Leuconostoc carnosum]KAA8382560.1 aminotransferase class V-fold PLP-dependent enzyme [Leuconostoc carnosum]QEA32746.1 aminotransferase class V-fold PLP-dependent enzyme [Leuconostoc ca